MKSKENKPLVQDDLRLVTTQDDNPEYEVKERPPKCSCKGMDKCIC